MALVSPSRRSDQETYALCADILETTVRIYKKMDEGERKQKVEENIKEQVQYLEDLKHKIDTHDYTKEDEHYWKMEEFWRKIEAKKLSPG